MNQYMWRFVVVLSIITAVVITLMLSPSTLFPIEGAPPPEAEQKQINNTEITLSDEVAFPSPVVQLQQTMAAGLVELAEPSLELIRGDLQEFSDGNTHETYSSPSELTDLELRLEQLQQLQKGLDK